MAKFSLSATLLTFFASPEHAQSIEGDLLEEARSRGRIWFWSHVVRTTLALWWKGFSESPLALSGLTAACGATWFLMILVGEIDDAPGLVVFGPLLLGFVCARAAPIRGIHASVAVALLGGAIIAGTSILNDFPVESVTDLMLAIGEGALGWAMTGGTLLLGSLVARRLVIRKISRTT